MTTEKPRRDENDERVDQEPAQDTRDLSEERKKEDDVTVDEESEQSFPASDPPSY